MTLYGTGFTGATIVTFNGVAATNLTVLNDMTITCTTPARSAGKFAGQRCLHPARRQR